MGPLLRQRYGGVGVILTKPVKLASMRVSVCSALKNAPRNAPRLEAMLRSMPRGRLGCKAIALRRDDYGDAWDEAWTQRPAAP